VRISLRLLTGFIFTIALQAPAYAALDLTVTQGVSSALPIAIVPFAGQSDLQAPNNVSGVVMTDLQNSGQFKVMDTQSMQQMPHTAADVNYSYWRKAGNDNVVVGNVSSSGNLSKVKFALLDVFKGQGQGGNQILAQQSFTVGNSKLRALAHHISDIIYQQLTGIRGVFSTRIVYVLVQHGAGGQSRYILDVADADGYNPKPLLVSSQPIMSPAWSHDGTRIAYVSFEKVQPKIFIQNVITGARFAVSSFPGINGAPAWSPDNNKLAVVLSKNGSPKIYIMDLNSKNLQQATFGTSIDTEPSWSPDGKSLIFTSDRGGGPQLYQLTLGSGKVQRLTFTGDYNARGSFSADGQSIVMIHRTDDNNYNIAVQDLQSGTLQVITHDGWDTSPSFAPNGRFVLYESDAGHRGVLGIASTDGRITRRLSTQEGSVQDPAWSPFLS